MDFKIFGLFRGITVDFTDVYLDYGAFIFDSEGKNNEKKDWRSGADYNRGDLCVDLKSHDE